MNTTFPSPPLSASSADCLQQLIAIAGKSSVLSDRQRTLRYRKGFRSGEGDALAVVFPTTLIKLWKILQVCVANDKAVIMQAANTGLTEGSTPNGKVDDYGREIVIINTMKMSTIRTLRQAKQVICFPGATLHQLAKVLKPFGREPHSEIGSSCIGASVIGGICNNSGGMLVRRGPAYTEMSLFARVDEQGILRLENQLGIYLGDTPEHILENLEQGNYRETDIEESHRHASCHDYEERIRDVQADTPARFNADPTRLYGASGSAGKLAVFAVRLDSFLCESGQQTICVGVAEAHLLTQIRHQLLIAPSALPLAGEYMDRAIFDLAAHYAKDTFAFIRYLGTAALPMLYACKSQVDRWLSAMSFLPSNPSDRLMQWGAAWLPNLLPDRWIALRQDYPHLLLLRVTEQNQHEVVRILSEVLPTKQQGHWFIADSQEGEQVFLHRFVAGGAAIRYKAIHHQAVEGVISLDFALPRHGKDWLEKLPASLDQHFVGKYVYAHFLCQVFHHDYIVRKGADINQIKASLLDYIAQKGGEYPAEHNVGHLYPAKPALASFYQQSDPTNSMNPGIGKMSKRRFYG